MNRVHKHTYNIECVKHLFSIFQVKGGCFMRGIFKDLYQIFCLSNVCTSWNSEHVTE